MNQVDRRAALGLMAGGGLAATAGATLTEGELGWNAAAKEYVLPPLPYDYDALEPAIDAETMRLHHDIHHAGYVRGLNNAMGKLAEIRDQQGDPKLIKHWSRELAFHGCGHINHVQFWLNMAPIDERQDQPTGALATAIDRDFGSFPRFMAHFKAASTSVEASGWGWLAWEPLGSRLLVLQAEKHQNLSFTGVVPLLGIDVWEHAYYLRYQNRRADYVSAFMSVINWKRVCGVFDEVS